MIFGVRTALHRVTGVLACVRTAAVFGVEACTVQVEVDVSFGLPDLRDGRICRTPACARAATACGARSATPASSFRLTASPSTSRPADIRKAGSSFDLPIALGILAATGLVKRRDIADIVLLGELSLDGGIQPARGVLPVAAAARRDRFAGLLLPLRNAAEASVVEGLTLLSGPLAHRSGRRAERPGSLRSSAAEARSLLPRTPRGASGAGLRRRPRAGAGPPRARDRRRRRAQRADDRAARVPARR